MNIFQQAKDLKPPHLFKEQSSSLLLIIIEKTSL